MTSAQLISAGVETAINKVLSMDDDSHIRLARLAGKSCEVYAIELGIPLLFWFTSEQVLVSSPVSEQFEPSESAAPFLNKENITRAKIDPNLECRIKLSLFAIPELQDMSNLTRLIREEKLDFEGNLTIAQQFADLFKQLDVDLEEELSHYVGDVAAHTVFEQAKRFYADGKQHGKLAGDTLRDLFLDEKPIAVRPIMVENFKMQVNDVRSATDRLDARIKRLEQQKNNRKEGI